VQNPGEEARSAGRKTEISSPDQSDDLISNLTPAAMAIALFGTGLLGGAIARRLLEGEQELWVWNRSPERCQDLIQAGARSAATAREVAEQADWLITVLSDGPSTSALLLGDLDQQLDGRTVIQIATIGPEESQALADGVAARGGRYLEAPVLGSKPEALLGRLQLMAGGEPAVFAAAQPILTQLSEAPRRLGAVGSAMACKLALNQLIASLTHAFSLSLHLVQRSGVEVEAFMEILRGSALYAPTFDKKLERELAGDYGNPNFPTAHLRKDLALFLQATQAAGLNGDGLEGLLHLLQGSTAAGLDGLDYCALHALTAGHGAARAPR
jgi:3-hydroxyisobutyrate dehydrogenase